MYDAILMDCTRRPCSLYFSSSQTPSDRRSYTNACSKSPFWVRSQQNRRWHSNSPDRYHTPRLYSSSRDSYNRTIRRRRLSSDRHRRGSCSRRQQVRKRRSIAHSKSPEYCSSHHETYTGVRLHRSASCSASRLLTATTIGCMFW